MSRSGAPRPLRLGIACLVAVSLMGATAATAKAPPKPVRVTVNDFFFGPSSVTVRKGGSVLWVWSSTNAYPHDVHLRKGPRGLKNRPYYSTRTTAVANARFQRTFRTPGTYRFICTIHPTEMKLTVVVKR